MKRFLALILVLSCVSLYAQDKEEVFPLSFSEVVRVDDAPADVLFTRGRAWFATTYKDSKSVLQMAENGRLIGKAAESFNLNGGFALGTIAVRITYDISVECRDGRYKYVIDNIVAKSHSGWANFGLLTTAENYKEKGSGAKILNKLWQDLKGSFTTFQMVLSMSLKEAMSKVEEPLSGDDW